MGAVIKVENLSKQYRLGEVGKGTLKDDFKRWRYRLMGKEDPFLKIGEENDRRKVSESDYVWALKDINFQVEQGDVVGIIGRNGAGKSTLLKILSRTTAPTTGSVKVKGRIASLLEVGTGFHGELSGRKNIYLNGAIMGLRKWEIDKKLDEIIDFAGVEKYLDTPVKRYSSGMYVRLAFAVAAHLEPDILILDEVLAVGDAEFQKKCLGKMKDVSQGQGRTVLFVSHNLASINSLCETSMLIDKGRLKIHGITQEVIKEYKLQNTYNSFLYSNPHQVNGITFVKVCTSTETELHEFGEKLAIEIRAKFTNEYKNLAIALQIKDENELSIINPVALNSNEIWVSKNEGQITCIFNNPRLYQGRYSITIHIGDKSTNEHLQTLEDACFFEITMHNFYLDYGLIKGAAVYMEDYFWETKKK